MAFTARDVMRRASLVLNDVEQVRWTSEELFGWIREACRQIALLKPSAVSKHVEIALVEGVLQSIPQDAVALVRVTRNLLSASGASPREGGTAITPATRHSMDSLIPGWTDPNVIPFSDRVAHVIQDMADPRAFYVVPGNDGTGRIEAIVAVMPPEMADPADPLDVDSYEAEVPVPDIYEAAVTDYVLYRAFSKDAALPGSAARAMAHYQTFAQAIGVKAQMDALKNIRGKEG